MRKLNLIVELNRDFEDTIEACVRRMLIEIVLPEFQKLEDRNRPGYDILKIDSVCELTGYSKATLYSKVSLGQIPCLARRKPLLFSREDIENWIKAGRPKTNTMDRVDEILNKYPGK